MRIVSQTALKIIGDKNMSVADQILYAGMLLMFFIALLGGFFGWVLGVMWFCIWVACAFFVLWICKGSHNRPQK